ncbi:TetR/AcrR family transcriptional regulator [Mucilaginibacter dorajii]|uniref:TetR/AcrR family transcriptional regulator n=1 Tax=Mucilaginibacter dorajii TaxID=692994 RepID=A0ABP7QZ11_9SPHI|nr:TetR/AcrR family transcriptional regulator [Mucilaginibacter dorajii]MCS3732289.1 AcrR family transcriptional regulator [Mucilaginibacter dorajii]
MTLETKNRIVAVARGLFLSYGIRSITMDDIASHGGISKKTIYRFFADKGALIEAVIDIATTQKTIDDRKANQAYENAVVELFLIGNQLAEISWILKPGVFHDLKIYYNQVFERLIVFKNDFLYQLIKHNIERGIKEGVYKADVNISIRVRFLLETLRFAFDPVIFPVNKFNQQDVQKEFFLLFLEGISTVKGDEMLRSKIKRQRI